MKNTFRITLALVFIVMISMASFATEKGKPEVAATMATTTMEGTILDADTQETLAGVTVKIAGTDTEVKTDLNGNFTIEGLIPGEYNLEVTYISYKEAKLVHTISTSFNQDVNLKLKSE